MRGDFETDVNTLFYDKLSPIDLNTHRRFLPPSIITLIVAISDITEKLRQYTK